MVKIHSCTQNSVSRSEDSVAAEIVTFSSFALTVFCGFLSLCLSRSVKFVSVSGGVFNGVDPKSDSARMGQWARILRMPSQS